MAPSINFTNHLIRESLIIFPILKMLWELYLHIRQLKVVDKTLEVPDELRRTFPSETFTACRSYALDKLQFRIFISLLEIFYIVSTIGWFSLYSHWQSAMEYAEYLGCSAENEILVSCMLVFQTNYMLALIDIPISIYETIIIESRYGFNKQTIKEFFVDRLLLFILMELLMLPVVACIVFVVKHGGGNCFYFLWILSSLVFIALVCLHPIYIVPLFFNINQYPSGELKRSFQDLASLLSFPITELYLIEGSKKSGHSNAYFTGIFGTERVVLFDTLLYRKNPETGKESGLVDNNILAIICHELGHWKFNHIWKRIASIILEDFIACIIVTHLISYAPLYESAGFPPDQKPVLIGLFAVESLLTPISTLWGWLTIYCYRICEYEADEFAVTLGYGQNLKNSLRTLHIDNLSFPVYDWLFSSWYRTHPSFLERIRRIDSLETKSE